VRDDNSGKLRNGRGYLSVSTSGAAALGSGRLSESICALRSAARSIRDAASAGFDVDLANRSNAAA
jgi:hypothetical protein